MTTVLARLDGVERRFGPVVALDGADLELRAGEVHGVLGANGAGKSTLFGVLGGMLRADAGVVEIDGAAVTLSSPRDAWRHGIALVHQHFTLVEAFSVLENLALGVRDRSLAVVRADAEQIMTRTGLRVPLDPTVETLGVGDRQRIEILKALLRDPRILVLDEPTAVLAPSEIDGLFSLLRSLADEGRAIALVAHKLDEVMSVADRVTVLRSGRTVLTARPSDHGVAVFVQAMVGDGALDPIAVGYDGASMPSDAPPSPPGETGTEPLGAPTASDASPTSGAGVVARLEGVSVSGDRGDAVRDVGLVVHAGEVVGIAGVEGNGQHELALVLAGRLTPDRGAVSVPDEVGLIPQDRTSEGLIAEFDLAENVALGLQRLPHYFSGPWVRWDAIRSAAEEVRQRFQVTAPGVATRAGDLSGGNQQRLIVGRELALDSTLLVAENPTRGLDITASAFVHEELRRLSASGIAIVLISTDLDEVIALSTSVYAMARGTLTRVPESERTRVGVGALMLGAAADG